jgi:hypothetical protein
VQIQLLRKHIHQTSQGDNEQPPESI